MRRWIAIGALLAVPVTLGLPAPESADGQCVATLTWRGQVYEAPGVIEDPGALVVGPRLRPKAKIPPCIDVIVPEPQPRPKPHPVVAREYQGVPPELGLSQYGDLFVATGFFPQLPGHPLHTALYGTQPGVPDATTHGRCRRSQTVRGRVVRTGLYDPLIDPAGRKRMLFLESDAQTRIEGFSQSGHPHLRKGDRVQITGLSCRDKALEPEHYLVPRRISPSGRRAQRLATRGRPPRPAGRRSPSAGG